LFCVAADNYQVLSVLSANRSNTGLLVDYFPVTAVLPAEGKGDARGLRV
jgi:hypothetical protein